MDRPLDLCDYRYTRDAFRKYPTNLPQTVASQKIIEYLYENHQIVTDVSNDYKINSRDLKLRLLLYMPRLFQDEFLPSVQEFTNECNRLGAYIKGLISPYIEWANPPSDIPQSPLEARFSQISENEAFIIHKHFHYLASFRKESIHLGLRTLPDDRLIALASLSQFDLSQILDNMPQGVDQSQVMVLSRVFAFGWAPKNTISHLLHHVYQWVAQERSEIRMLITYLNPNLGLTGASYKASNWIQFGQECCTRYVYIDGYYITDRELIQRYGTADVFSLKNRLGSSLEYTTLELTPLLLFAYMIDKQLRGRYHDDFNNIFWRPL